MKIGYARVSTTNKQNDSLEKQIEILIKNGADPDNIYQEKVTATSTAQRTQLQDMIKHARKGDTIVVTKIDRLARSISDLNKIVSDLNDRGVSVQFLKEQMLFKADDTNSINRLLFNILGSFAQFERDLIVERTSEGRERAKKEGKHMGRKGSSSPRDIKKAINMYNNRETNKMSVADILRATSVKKSTFYHELKKVQQTN
ncbi:recombinase family protein [Macrococcoides caseolyticum]|uniref:recombinase family protein n=1 Tax=Macrococcoides caseolyticum TaxID=69966 RepID=UPI0020B6E669|nr:recombinase family protein [Macrococcus caseolyticus]UTH05717.1 recombinase family protein [Macrococcus caseolyticus]